MPSKCMALPAGEARVVVAVDIGTSFSGFAYAKRSQPNDVFKVYDWPSASRAGAKPYCKTQTSLFYARSEPGLPFRLVDWGWSGFLSYIQTICSTATSPLTWIKLPSNDPRLSALPALNHHPIGQDHADEELAETTGFFATNFKLLLAPDADDSSTKLPGGLTVERMLVDYLQKLSTFIISELQVNYGEQFGMADVQWCLTVPAIWDERAKQVMKVCAEKAGMVKGTACPSLITASPFPLDIILEPEAASICCQHKLGRGLKLMKGDRLLVVDVGGGTIDLVVHQKVDNDPDSMRVDEVVASYGDIGGGTFVDANFFCHLYQKIGCFQDFCRTNASIFLMTYEWWQGLKARFDGEGFSAELLLPRKLSEAWEKYDQSRGIDCHDEDYYDELRLEDWEIMKIFHTEVEKVLRLIEKQIKKVNMLMVVGGFSASPYLRKCIKRAFSNRVEEVIIPEDPGSVICHGAVQLHMMKDIIQSRIAKRTYGMIAERPMRSDDPSHLCYINDDGEWYCQNCIIIFVTAGERVPLDLSVKRKFFPTIHGQTKGEFELWSSTRKHLKYVTDVDTIKEGSFTMDITEEGTELDKARCVEVTMVFGASHIKVSAERLNFAKAGTKKPISIEFHKA